MNDMTRKERIEALKKTTLKDIDESAARTAKIEFEQENPIKPKKKPKKPKKTINPGKGGKGNYKKGGHVKSSAETSVIKGAATKGSAQGSTIQGAPTKGSAEGSTIAMTPMKMNHGGPVKGKGSMLSITIEQKPINKKTMNMIKQAEKAGNVVKMSSGGAAKRGYGKARR